MHLNVLLLTFFWILVLVDLVKYCLSGSIRCSVIKQGVVHHFLKNQRHNSLGFFSIFTIEYLQFIMARNQALFSWSKPKCRHISVLFVQGVVQSQKDNLVILEDLMEVTNQWKGRGTRSFIVQFSSPDQIKIGQIDHK